MPYYDDKADEDWYDDVDEPDDEVAARCPECGGPVHIVTDKCPACGYWLSEADRRAMWTGTSKPSWIRITTILVLVAILFGLLVAGVAFL